MYCFRFSLNLFAIDIFWKITQIPNFKKILPVTNELFHAEGQTGKTKLAVHSRNCRKHLKTIQIKITNLFITLMKNTLFYMRHVCSCRIYKSFRGIRCIYYQDSYTFVRTTCPNYAYRKRCVSCSTHIKLSFSPRAVTPPYIFSFNSTSVLDVCGWSA
jgi:hypothetical protein